MKKLFLTTVAVLFSLTLAGCLASTTSPVSLNCDFTQEKPLWEMPPACVGF